MLGKLLKYDLKSMLKTIGLIWAAAFVLAIINHFTLGRLEFSGALAFISQVVPMILYIGVLLAMAVLTLIFIIQRFYNGLLRDEGYLSFTLPVKPWQLITSKGIAAVIVLAISIIVGFASVFVLLPQNRDLNFFSEIWRVFRFGGTISGFQSAIIIAELFINIVLSLAASVYLIYASISLGHLFKKHRKAMAFVMFMAINFIISIFTTLLGYLLFGSADLDIWVWFENHVSFSTAFGYVNFAMLIFFLINAVQLVIFHVITERILSNHLNLE